MEPGTTRRRWIGGIALLAAGAMLICGQMLFNEHLKGGVFLVYWLCCFVLTGVAIVSAVMDVRALQRTVRDEHRNLLSSTLENIEKEAKGRNQRLRDGG